MEPDYVVPPDPVFSLTAPSRGDTLYAGLPYTIHWISDERTGDLVRIDLLDGTGIARTIAVAAANNGAYAWAPPQGIAGKDGYRIAIVSLPDSSFSDTGGYFTIVNYSDAYEVDSSASLATAIDTSAVAQIHTLPGDDIDWFRFNAAAGTTYCVQTFGTAALWIRLFGRQAMDTLALLSSSSAAGPVPNALVIWTCASSGRYYFSISGDTARGNRSYSVSVKAGIAILKMLSPAQGSNCTGGAGTAVTWAHSSNAGSLVSLYLYRGDTLVQTVVSGTSNNDFYYWTVPVTVPSSARYRIKIASDNDLSVNDFGEYFTINNVPKAITITAPADTSAWNAGSSHHVSWTYTGNPGRSVSLALYSGAAFTATIATGVDIAGGYFNWQVPGGLSASSSYRIKITSEADTGISAVSALFAITKIPNTLSITSPGADTNWNTGTTHTISWAHTGDPGAYVRLGLFNGDSLVDTIAAAATLASGRLSWLVPLTLSTSGRYRVKIAGITDTSISGFSDWFTITYLAPSITVAAPGAATVWNAGLPCPVVWISSGAVGSYVSIGLYQDSTLVQPLIASAYNSGSYQATLPSGLAGGNRYRIKVASVASPSVYSFSGYVTVVPMPVSVKITSPNAQSSWTTGGTYLLQWTYSGPGVPIVKIELFDSSTFVRTISANEYASDGGYVWLVPFSIPSGGRYRIKITNTSIDTVSDISEPFTIANVPATIKVTAPTAGVSWNAGSTHTLGWNASSNVPGTYVTIALFDDSSSLVAPIASNVNRAGGSYSWTLPTALKGSANYRIRIGSATDSTVHTFSDRFTVIPQPNSLTVTAPAGTASWSAGSYYSIYWSYTGSPGTTVTIDLYDSSAFVQSVSPNVYTTNGSFLWLVPASLLPDSRYRIKITSTTQDSVFDFSDIFSIKTSVTGDAYEPDSTPALAKPIAKGGAAQDHMLTVGDQDWFTLTAAGGTSYTIETHGSTDTYLDLFSTNGTTLLMSDDDSGSELLNAKITWTPTTSGVYFFRVKGSAGAVGGYTVTVR